MNKDAIDNKIIYYPPGGILLWLIIFVELITFGIALVAMVIQSKEDINAFHSSKLLLNNTLGSINTVLLLSSGFFMATALHFFKQNNVNKTSFYLKFVLLTGALFCTLKGLEFYKKIEVGITLDYNMFFTFYWLLTGFHLIHVLVGMVILIILYKSLNKNTSSVKPEDFEAGATFWHMCDLIWLLIFPVIYLLF